MLISFLFLWFFRYSCGPYQVFAKKNSPIAYPSSRRMVDYKTSSDQDLLSLIRGGNQFAFAEVYNRYKTILLLHACRMVDDEEEARDIVQDTIAGLWAKRKKLTVIKSLDSYLYAVVRNKILDYIAHNKVVDKYLDSLEGFLQDSTPAYDEKMVEQELMHMFELAVDSLPKKMREIFVLSRNEGLSHKEIAEKLGLSDKTVKRQVANAIKIIKLKVNLKIILLFFS